MSYHSHHHPDPRLSPSLTRRTSSTNSHSHPRSNITTARNNRASSSSSAPASAGRRRASSTTTAAFPSGPFLFTTPPFAPPPIILRPHNPNDSTVTSTTTADAANAAANVGPPPPYTPFPLTAKSRSESSPHISHHQNISSATFLVQYQYAQHPQAPMRPAQGACSDSESEPDHPHAHDEGDEDNNVIFTTTTAKHGAAANANGATTTTTFRSRILSRHHSSKGITTAPGQRGAGETETEADEPPKHLPTARIVPVSGPLVPPNTLEQVITPLLFEASRLLSIVPSVFGVLYNLFNAWYAPINGKVAPVDYVVSALWAVLTGYQCLCLTTGLFQRWKVYYPPLSTLIRLLALQAICWPATHFSLTLIGHEKRPVICWAAIGSFTCCSRAVQLWVTSNLWWETSSGGESWRLKLGGRWGGRRWDWTEVLVKCGVPMGACYFAMAWAEALRRELSGC